MENLNTDTSTSSGSFNPTGLNKKYEETSFDVDKNDIVNLYWEEEKNVDAAREIIHEKFPKHNTDVPPFTASLDEYKRVIVKLNRIDGKYHLLLNKYGKLNEKLPKAIKDYLGPQAEDIIETNEEKIEILNKKKVNHGNN